MSQGITKQGSEKFFEKVLKKGCFRVANDKNYALRWNQERSTSKKEENKMGKTELLEDTAPELELDELDADEPDLDDFGDEDVDDDLDSLSSDVDRWSDDDDLYGWRLL